MDYGSFAESLYEYQPEYFECDQCHNRYNINLFYDIESDTCHHCQHYNGDMSDKQLAEYVKEWDESRELMEAVA